jgi:hypothetical protein
VYLIATRVGLHRVVAASHRAATQVKARWKLCNEARLFAAVTGPDGSHTQGAQFAEVKVCAYARSAAELSSPRTPAKTCTQTRGGAYAQNGGTQVKGKGKYKGKKKTETHFYTVTDEQGT